MKFLSFPCTAFMSDNLMNYCWFDLFFAKQLQPTAASENESVSACMHAWMDSNTHTRQTKSVGKIKDSSCSVKLCVYVCDSVCVWGAKKNLKSKLENGSTLFHLRWNEHAFHFRCCGFFLVFLKYKQLLVECVWVRKSDVFYGFRICGFFFNQKFGQPPNRKHTSHTKVKVIWNFHCVHTAHCSCTHDTTRRTKDSSVHFG